MHETGDAIRIVRAQPEDAQRIADVIRTVWESLENKDWFVPDDVGFVARLLEPGNGMAWKAVDGATGRLAGILNVALPGRSEENLGWDTGLSADELEHAAHIDSVAILPEFRGRRLQHRMMQAAEEELKKRSVRYLFCTVHPENRFSRDNMVRLGLHTVKTTEKYGGLKREIMMKTLAFCDENAGIYP